MNRLTEPIGPRDHVLGIPNALTTLVEYGDYQCPHCARAHYEVAEVLRRVGNDVRYAFRHFPLTHLHPHALLAAQAAEAAGAEGRFWPMHSMLFANQDTLDLADLMACAETVGVDLHRFARDLQDGVYLPKIETDFRSGVGSGAHGTPTFFLNGVRVDGRWDADSLTAAIQQAMLRSAPVPLRRPPAH
jgi:protein-disulfide isomerase